MISGIGQYIHGGFYQGKAEIFDSAITSYDSDRDQDSLDIITSLMVESGFRDSDNCYIDLDKEFFTDGAIDRDKCDNFKKELILHYSLNQLKYSFFGTQSKMTRITEDALKREGKDLNDYLPVEERRKRAKEKRDKYNSKIDKQKKENKVPIYIYADGSLSSTVDNDKCKTTFNKLGGNGGSFNFSKGYDPNHKVDNKGWVAGFNRDQTWEVIENRNSRTNSSLSLVDNHREISTDVELLFDDDYLYLTDNENLLLEGIEEEYFSVTGELYAKREIDREKSIDSIKDAIRKSGVKEIKGIVLKDDNKETVKYYKDNFNEFITKDTVFTSVTDNKLSETITGIKDRQREEQLSLGILSQFNSLKAEGRSADEIIQALEAPDKANYSVELNIFSNPEDMTLFLNQESVKVLDSDTTDYIRSLDVPMESSRELSRSFQNIINSKTIAEDTNISTRDLLSKSYNRVVNKDSSERDTITKTVSLSSLLNRKADTKTNLNNPDERSVWLKNNIEVNYSAELSSRVESILIKDELSEAENASIINGFNHIGDIASSTGMTPIELVNYVLEDEKKEKNVHIERDLNTIIDNTASTPPIAVNVSNYQNRSNTSLDLTNSVDIIKFANSPVVDNYEDDSTKEELIRYLRSKPVSIKNSKEFSLDVVNTLNNRQRFPNGSNSLIIARTIADSINGNNTEVNKLVEKSLNIYKKDEPAQLKYNLLDENDLNSFKFDPILTSLGEDEAEDLISYLNTKPVSNSNSEEFSRGIMESLNKTSSFPEYTKARDIAESVASRVNGLSVPKSHEVFVNSVLSKNKLESSSTLKLTETRNTVPVSYNLTTSKGITQFSKDPVMESFSSDEQAELINFLKTKPVPEAQSREYTEALISGIRNNKNQNPAEYARILTKAMASMPVVKESTVVPMTYNFSDRSSVDSFSSDPIVTAFSTDDQKELLSYLKSNPVPVQKSKEFSESLVRGLKENNKQNPAEFAKALTKVLNGESTQDIPAEFKPLLSTSLNVSNSNNKAVPLNYNFSDKGDVNRLQFDPVMASFSESDQSELINYLKSSPVSVKDSPQFSSMLTSGLRSLPKMTRPVSFASTLATSMNRKKANLSKPAKSYNLMSSSGLSSFCKTKMFRDSGINKASFTSVVNNHRPNITSYTPNSSVMFPMSSPSEKYHTTTPPPTRTTTLPPSHPPTSITNDIMLKNNKTTKPILKNIIHRTAS